MSQLNQPIITLDINQVADILKCSPKTVLEKAGLGELRGAKVGFLNLKMFKRLLNQK